MRGDTYGNEAANMLRMKPWADTADEAFVP